MRRIVCSALLGIVLVGAVLPASVGADLVNHYAVETLNNLGVSGSSSVLYGISCPEPGLCMAVGMTKTTAGVETPLVAQYKDGVWTVMPNSAPGFTDGVLKSVQCRNKLYTCFATGSGTQGTSTVPLVEFYAFRYVDWTTDPHTTPTDTLPPAR